MRNSEVLQVFFKLQQYRPHAHTVSLKEPCQLGLKGNQDRLPLRLDTACGLSSGLHTATHLCKCELSSRWPGDWMHSFQAYIGFAPWPTTHYHGHALSSNESWMQRCQLALVERQDGNSSNLMPKLTHDNCKMQQRCASLGLRAAAGQARAGEYMTKEQKLQPQLCMLPQWPEILISETS